MRIRKRLKLTDAAQKLGVSQPTLSAWESGRKSPSLNSLLQMAELYGVTTDYLLGKDLQTPLNPTEPIPNDMLPVLDGKPIWVPNKGWALVDAANSILRMANGEQIAFADVQSPTLMPECFSDSKPPHQAPMDFDSLPDYESVWVEPISKDSELRQALRGRYRIRNGFAENDCGNRFALSSYGATWLAFKMKE